MADRPTRMRAGPGAPKSLPLPAREPTLKAMNTLDANTAHMPHAATETVQHRWEAEGIAEARAELDTGLYVDANEIRTWIDSLRSNAPLPPPPTRRL